MYVKVMSDMVEKPSKEKGIEEGNDIKSFFFFDEVNSKPVQCSFRCVSAHFFFWFKKERLLYFVLFISTALFLFAEFYAWTGCLMNNACLMFITFFKIAKSFFIQ